MLVILMVFIFFNIFYFYGKAKQDFGIIDTAWGLSFVIVYAVGLYQAYPSFNIRAAILGLMVVIWAFRLSGYIYLRNRKIGKEDYRYHNWRIEWGEKANLYFYLKVYMLQASLSILVASPLYLIHFYEVPQSSLNIIDYVGISFWIIGFLFEAIGDHQKNKFKNDPANKGKFCRVGLWAYTRHPNYFGETLLWWGVFLICIPFVPYYFAAIGPAIITFCILKISGVSMLEERYETLEGFEDYKLTTNKFFPWFPRRRHE